MASPSRHFIVYSPAVGAAGLRPLDRTHYVRILLTLIAVALVAALSAALVAPLFIDWSAHRAQIEAELSDVLGAPVVVSGSIDIRILPLPYVELGGVSVGEAGGGAPVLTCEKLHLEAALASLPSGRIRFSLARLDRPTLTLARGDDGALRLPDWRSRTQADRVAFDRIVATDGRLRVVGDGEAFDAPGLDVDATAGSLIGPFRGSVSAASGKGPIELRFATGTLENSALPIRLEVEEALAHATGLFDGAVALSSRGLGVHLAYSGSATLSGQVAAGEAHPPFPWRISGSLRADFGGATLEKLTARFGPDERALEATGAARLQLGASPGFSAELLAKELNIDALLRQSGEDSVSPTRALTVIERAVESLGSGRDAPMPIRVALSTPMVIVGAQTLSDLALRVNASPGAQAAGELEVGLPGQSSLRLSGALELGSAAQFKGHVAANFGDLAQLRDWAAKDAPELAGRLSLLDDALPYRRASANGDVEISAVAFAARNLQLVVDRTALNGAMAFTRTLGEERGRLFMDLRGDVLDVDALPNLAASAAVLGDIDLSLSLEASKLRVARVGEATIEGGSLSLKMRKTGDDLALDRFSVVDLGGAALEASGASGSQGRWLNVQLKADRLREFAAMIGRIAPGRLSRLLIQRADALSPARATFEARATGRQADGGLLDSLKAEGSAGPTQFTLKAERQPGGSGGIVAALTLDAAEGGALLQQIGLKPAAISSGRARAEASASGKWDAGFDARAAVSIAGASLTWRGRVKPSGVTEGDAPLFGTAALKADNVMPLLATLGLGNVTGAPTVPIDLTGDIVLRGDAFRFPRVAGSIAGSKVAGRLDWRPAPEPSPVSLAEADIALARSVAGESPDSPATQIEGELGLDRASLGALLGLSLGAPQAAKPGARWSDARFAPPLVEPPPLDLRLKIDSLDLADGWQARGATARLKMDGDRLDLDEMAMDIAGTRASGQLTVRRDGAVATLAGQASADSALIDRPGLHGRLTAALAFASTGQSPSALVAGLVGEGHVQTASLAIPRLDPAALSRVLAKAQGPDARIDETNVVHALGVEFDRQAMTLPDGAAPVVVNGGVIRVGPVRVGGKSGDATASADFDLRSQNLTIRAAFTEANGDKYWSGPPPAIAVVLDGAADAPTRQIDAAGFVAGLAAQAIARESDRIAALEADIRERAAFNRRLKAEQFMRQREAELDAFAAEQARLKSEQERKRVEDELLKASQALQDKSSGAAVAAPAPISAAPKDTSAAASASAPASKLKSDQTDPTASGLY